LKGPEAGRVSILGASDRVWHSYYNMLGLSPMSLRASALWSKHIEEILNHRCRMRLFSSYHAKNHVTHCPTKPNRLTHKLFHPVAKRKVGLRELLFSNVDVMLRIYLTFMGPAIKKCLGPALDRPWVSMTRLLTQATSRQTLAPPASRTPYKVYTCSVRM